MPLPETIPVKYTEEEAEYLSVRPVMRQTFQREELLDMLLSVAGKDVTRLQQILRAGTTVYNFYRYWWEGFEAPEDELRVALMRFPDADVSRPFHGADCTAAVFEAQAPMHRVLAEFRREEASSRRWLRRQSFWDRLMQLVEQVGPAYQTYSYARRGDVFALALTAELFHGVAQEAKRLARRDIQAQVNRSTSAHRLLLICPRR